MTTTQQSILRAIVFAVLVIGVFAMLVFKTGLHHDTLRGGLKPRTSTGIKPGAITDRRAIFKANNPTLNKPAVRWSELTEVGATNSARCGEEKQ